MQMVIWGFVPLADLACLACVSKQLHTACVDRVRKRDGVVAALLESHFTAEFREGLPPAQTALPWDLVVHPQVRGSSFIMCCSTLHYIIMSQLVMPCVVSSCLVLGFKNKCNRNACML
jgi:hypothetical protein